MTFSENYQHNLVFALAWTVIHSLWQCGLIAFLSQVLSQLAGVKNANLRCRLFSSALALCFAWSVVTFSRLFESASLSTTGGLISSSQIRMIAAWSSDQLPPVSDYLDWIALFWLIGCVSMLLKLTFELARAQHLKHHGTELVSTDLQTKFLKLKQQIGLGKEITIRLSQRINIPCVIGHFKPVILLPSSVILGLSPTQIEMIILHELAHIQRNDVLINFVQTVLKILFFFNPAVHFLSHRIDQEREHACDDLAIKICGNTLLYARTLQAFAEMRLSLSNQLALSSHFSERNSMLKQRVVRLFVKECKPPAFFKTMASALGLAFATLTIVGCSYLQVNDSDLNVDGKGVRFEISIKKNGSLIAEPALLSEFGKEASFEVADQIKVVNIAQKPIGQKSHVEASIYQFDGKNWVLGWHPTMQAEITKTPSFEFTSNDNQYRVVIKQRLADLKR